MNLSTIEIQSIAARQVSDFTPTEVPIELEGGNLNYVWRLPGEQKNLIVKVAPPYIAANPEVPLSFQRISFEAKALQLFQDENPLATLSSEEIRPPYFLFYNPEKHLLVMEDVGNLPHLGEVSPDQVDPSETGSAIGRFIGRLHKETYQDSNLAQNFHNADIQQTRLEVQYQPAGEYASKAGIANTSNIRSKTESLGTRLLEPGRCLVMGDLWPPSLLVDQNTIRIIDWEFCHFGRPLQDVAHFAAHCWMQAHTASSSPQSELFKQLWLHFWNTYQQETGAIFPKLFDAAEYNDAATHIGAEILVRVTGPFKEGYVYQPFDLKQPPIREAAEKARQLILADDFSSLWE